MAVNVRKQLQMDIFSLSLCGVPCLELLSALSKDSAKAKLLKNQKDQLGRSHPEDFDTVIGHF